MDFYWKQKELEKYEIKQQEQQTFNRVIVELENKSTNSFVLSAFAENRKRRFQTELVICVWI